jgi:hypothetical protein
MQMETAFGLNNLELSKMIMGKYDCTFIRISSLIIILRKGIASFAGQIFMVGSTYGNFDGLANTGSSDIFVAQFDADGSVIQADQFGSSQEDTARY